MVESTVSDIVTSTVTTDNPLAACREELLVCQELLAMRTICVLHERQEFVRNLTGNCRIVLILKPLSEESLDFV